MKSTRIATAAVLTSAVFAASAIPATAASEGDGLTEPGASQVKKSSIQGRLIWSGPDSSVTCPVLGQDSKYLTYEGVHKTDPADGNGQFMYQSNAKTSPDHQGLQVTFQYWEGYRSYKKYVGCVNGQGYRFHVPHQMQVRRDQVFSYTEGTGGTAFVRKGSWSDGNLCAQYEPATWNDRTRKPCTTYAAWVLAQD